jgi:hypothetical protein
MAPTELRLSRYPAPHVRMWNPLTPPWQAVELRRGRRATSSSEGLSRAASARYLRNDGNQGLLFSYRLLLEFVSHSALTFLGQQANLPGRHRVWRKKGQAIERFIIGFDMPRRNRIQTDMPRKLRLEYPGAMYHVVSRGDRGESIYLDDVDRQDFVKTLAEVCQNTGLAP